MNLEQERKSAIGNARKTAIPCAARGPRTSDRLLLADEVGGDAPTLGKQVHPRRARLYIYPEIEEGSCAAFAARGIC